MKTDTRLAAAGLMVALFALGGVAGGVTVHLWDERQDRIRIAEWRERAERRGEDRERGRGRPGDPRSFTSARAVERLTERLELSEVQQDSILQILERQRSSAEALLREMGPQLQATVDSTNARIRRQLGPDQQAAFDALLQEDRGVLGRRFLRPPPPDSGEVR